MSQDPFRQDADLLECSATVTAITAQVMVTKIKKKSTNTRRVVLGFGA